MKKTILLILVALLGLGVSYAQQKVTGKVTSKEDGQPIPYATVTVKGHSSAIATTSNDGDYSISIPSGGTTLVFSFVGMKELEVPISSRAVIDVVLEPAVETLQETIVTAMGIKKEKKALGYAVQDIKADELIKHKDANVVNSLNGKIAGVNITNSGGAPGSSSSIIIRGGTSLERDNQPLFVIDGMPIDNSTGQGDNSGFDGSTNSSTTNGNRAMDINPEDIESISVLKGPAAAALYGLRAAAGAIIITTKKGEEGKVTVSYNARFGTNWANRLPEQQNMYKQGSYYKSSTLITQTMRSWGDPYAAGEQIYNNMENFFEDAYSADNNVSVSGGSKNGNFYLSASNLYQTGIVPTTDYVKSTFRFNGEQKYGIFTFGANASYTTSRTTKTLTGSGLWGSSGNGAMEAVLLWPKSDNMEEYLNDNGTKKRMFPSQNLADDFDNPYWLINKNPQTDKTNRFLGNIYTSIKVADWINVTYKLGIDNYTSQYQSKTYPGSGVKEAWQNGMISETSREYEFMNSNLMVNMNKTFFEHWDFSLLLGTSADDTYIKSNSIRGENFVLPDWINVNNVDDRDKYYTQSIANKRIVGVYGDFRVSYKSMVYLGITGRNDWTSTLTKENRSFFYPSFSGSFVFTELIPKNSILTFGKFRASWAEVGKDAPAYQTKTYLFGPENTIGGGFRNYWTKGNKDLKPETTTSAEFGLELKFLNGRLGLDMAVYENKSIDQIVQPRVSNATGYILSYMNIGTIRNRGIEATLTARPVATKDFQWDVMLNLSHNKGKVESLSKGIPILYVTDVQVGNAKAASFDNGDFMGISGQLWNRDKDGNLILDWKTGYPTTDNLATKKVGNREPDLIGGLSNNLSYKGFNLSFLFDFRIGGDVYNGTEYIMTQWGMSKRTENRNLTTTFTGVAKNPVTGNFEPYSKEVKMDESYYINQYLWNAPNFIERVNWLRLRSVSLSYNLPQSLLQKTKVIKDANIVLTGTNLLLFTNYSGMDPETSAAGAGVVGSGSVGIDYCGVPATAGFSVGLNVKF